MLIQSRAARLTSNDIGTFQQLVAVGVAMNSVSPKSVATARGAVTIRHVRERWLRRPQGEPSGVCTGQRKPADECQVSISITGKSLKVQEQAR